MLSASYQDRVCHVSCHDRDDYPSCHRRLFGLRRIIAQETLLLLLSGDGAQSPGQAAYFAKNSASEQMDFSLFSHKPHSSSSLTRPSYKSLPNTCVSCEYR
jgi:hypothetical protein